MTNFIFVTIKNIKMWLSFLLAHGVLVGQEDRVVLISRYKESTPTWFKRPHIGIRMYPMYQRINASDSRYAPNHGFEAGVYLKYIVDNYAQLPTVSILAQIDLCGLSQVSFLKRVQAVDTKTLKKHGGYLPLNSLKVMNRGLGHWYSRGYGKRVEKCWRHVASMFDPRLFENHTFGKGTFKINMVCCACFAVHKENILRIPFATWAKLYDDMVVRGSCTGGSRDLALGKHETAGAFEHLAHVIFGGKPALWTPVSIEDIAPI